MKITKDQLRQIIIEEYILEEGLAGNEKAEELLKKILGPEKYCQRYPERCKPPEDGRGGDTIPMQRSTKATETMPVDLDIPSDDAPERDVSGFEDRAGPPLEDQLIDLIQGLPPEEVAELFQTVFEKLPGVELSDPEEEPESLYSPGAEGRPVAGFKLEELQELIRRVFKDV